MTSRRYWPCVRSILKATGMAVGMAEYSHPFGRDSIAMIEGQGLSDLRHE